MMLGLVSKKHFDKVVSTLVDAIGETLETVERQTETIQSLNIRIAQLEMASAAEGILPPVGEALDMARTISEAMINDLRQKAMAKEAAIPVPTAGWGLFPLGRYFQQNPGITLHAMAEAMAKEGPEQPPAEESHIDPEKIIAMLLSHRMHS